MIIVTMDLYKLKTLDKRQMKNRSIQSSKNTLLRLLSGLISGSKNTGNCHTPEAGANSLPSLLLWWSGVIGCSLLGNGNSGS